MTGVHPVLDLLRKATERTPDAIAVEAPDRAWTYRQFSH